MLHEPSVEVLVSMTHPAGALFEQPFSLEDSVKDHRGFQMALEEKGCKVLLLKDILEGCDTPEKRKILEEAAMKSLEYKWADCCDDASRQDYYISDVYKWEVIRKASNQQLVSYLFLRPTVYLAPEPKNTGVVTDHVSCQPLGNLVFTRDQQITTQCGIVMGRMSNHQRRYETNVLKTAWNILACSPVEIPESIDSVSGKVLESMKIQVRLVGEIPAPFTLEGGDYLQQFNLSLCGAGYRTTESSSLYLMKKGLLCRCETGSSCPCGLLDECEKSRPYYHAIVRDGFDHNQERIHLDCILAFLNESTVLIDETVLNDRRRRYVDVYECNHGSQNNLHTGSFKLIQCQVPLDEFLAKQNIKLIHIKHDQQLAYGVNVLSCGRGSIVSVCREAADYVNSVIDTDDRLKDHMHCNFVEFRGVTSMYGSAHCASQAIYREHAHSEPSSPTEENEFSKDSEKSEECYFCDYPFSHIEAVPFSFDCIMNVPSNLENCDIPKPRLSSVSSSFSGNLIDLQDDLIDEVYRIFKRLTTMGVNVRFELHPFSVPYKNVLAGRNVVSFKDKVYVSNESETMASFIENYKKDYNNCVITEVSTSGSDGKKRLTNSVFVLGDKIMCKGEEDYEILSEVFGSDVVEMLSDDDNGNYTVVNGVLVFEDGTELPNSVSELSRRIGVSLPLHREIFGISIRDILAGL